MSARTLVAVALLAAVPQVDAHNKIYWTESGTGKIRRADLDGANVEDLVTTGLTSPASIALDLAMGKMYWADLGAGKIQRANLDGTTVEDLVTGLTNPYGIALDLVAEQMYWTNMGEFFEFDGIIQRASIDGSAIENLVVSGLLDPRGIALDVAAAMMYWADSGRIHRASMNGSSPEELVLAFDSPRQIALDLDAGKIYWTTVFFKKGLIQCANLDGTNVETVVSAGGPLGGPTLEGLALDPPDNKLYWTSGVVFPEAKIKRASLNGLNQEELVTGVPQPLGIALDTRAPIPATSAWTMTLLALGVLVAGSILARRSGRDRSGMRSIRKQAILPMFLGALLTATATPAHAEEPPAWCAMGEMDEDPACTRGPCDDPVVRDPWIPGPLTPVMTIRLKFNVFGEDDASVFAASEDQVNWQVNQLNEAFRPYRIQFTHETQLIPDSRFYKYCPGGSPCYCAYRCTTFLCGEEGAMKNAYADSPNQKLNIYVVCTHVFNGQGYFPWCPNPRSKKGGIIIDSAWFGGLDCGPVPSNVCSPSGSDPCRVLVHEIGHNLGLWHTFHGRTEVPACSPCYETAVCTGVDSNGLCADPSCDQVGDLCCDTPAADSLGVCGAEEAQDACTGLDWAPSDDANYMSYGGVDCWDHFSDQQAARMRCWTCDRVSGWIVDSDCDHNGITDSCELAGSNTNDCNANGVDDTCDIDCAAPGCNPPCGGSDDCNSNGIPDECESNLDCQPNGVPDICDVEGGTSADCNCNNVPDECESSEDCNSNGIQDICEMEVDCNINGVLDECDIAGGTSGDCNTNAVPDECEGPIGACCLPNGNCIEVLESCCQAQGGLWAEQFNCFGQGPPYVFCAPP